MGLHSEDRNATILIVDDDGVHRTLLQLQLANLGYDVVIAQDGQAAWELLQAEPIQFVITDWVMPYLDGPQLARRIRAADQPFYTYIILLSVRADRSNIIDGLDSGVDDYLVKPCDPRELNLRIKIGMRILNLESRLRESRDELERLATHDSLTELLNRRAIYDYAAVEVARAARELLPISLVLLDIDHFKCINDQYGHPVGDRALRLVTDTILQSIRPYDRAGRWGGEEFLLVFPGTTLQEACTIAERVRANIAAARLIVPGLAATGIAIYVSMGVANSRAGNPVELELLISQADAALYQAKHSGRNCVCLFSSA